MTDTEREIYLAWREAESWQVPMTEEGQNLANRRYNAFKKGWEACIADLLQKMDKGCIERGCACFDYRVDKND